MRGDFGERAERASVALDRDHLRRAFREQRAGEAAGTGTDLDDGDARERPGRAGDLSGQVEVEEEVLAERLAGVKPVRRDDVAQRRQAVGGEAHRVNRSASLTAAMRLAGLAMPLPRNVERHAMIGRGAHERQAERDIDALVEGKRLRPGSGPGRDTW